MDDATVLRAAIDDPVEFVRGLDRPILEIFVFSELRKIASWSDQRCSFLHFRDKDRNEVDIVMENQRGEIVDNSRCAP